MCPREDDSAIDAPQADPDRPEAVGQGGDRATDPESGKPFLRRTKTRRRLALLVVVVGVAGLVAYWSRNRPVEVELTYDFGKNASRVSRVSVSLVRDGKVEHPVDVSFPTGQSAPRRYRHTVTLQPGTYTVRWRLHLRAQGDASAEVRKDTIRVKVSGSGNQRIKLRLR